jgi:hypothetical protein
MENNKFGTNWFIYFPIGRLGVGRPKGVWPLNGHLIIIHLATPWSWNLPFDLSNFVCIKVLICIQEPQKRPMTAAKLQKMAWNGLKWSRNKQTWLWHGLKWSWAAQNGLNRSHNDPIWPWNGPKQPTIARNGLKKPQISFEPLEHWSKWAETIRYSPKSPWKIPIRPLCIPK